MIIHAKFDELDKVYLEEQLLMEDHKFRYRAAAVFQKYGLNEKQSEEAVRSLLKRIIAYHGKSGWLERYLPGIALQISEYAKLTDRSIETLVNDIGILSVYTDYLECLKDLHLSQSKQEQKETEEEFNRSTYNDIFNKVNEMEDKIRQEEAEILDTQTFEPGDSDYSIIPIESYEEFNDKFGGDRTGDQTNDKPAGDGGTAWCGANDIDQYLSFVNGGERQFFVIAKNGWENIYFDEETNAITPFDEYGMSLIAITVYRNSGELYSATLRSNHEGTPGVLSADFAYRRYSVLNRAVNMNVKDPIVDYLVHHPDVDVLQGLEDYDEEDYDEEDYDDETPTLWGEEISESDWQSFDGTKDWVEDFIEDQPGITTPSGYIGDVFIPDGVEELDDEVFANFSSARNIYIPRSVTYIGSDAFFSCWSATFLNADDPSSPYTLQNVDQVIDSAFRASGLDTVVLDTIATVQGKAFANSKIRSAIIKSPDLYDLGDYAFYNCSYLTDVDLTGSAINYIDESCFTFCRNLKNIEFPACLQTIADGVFEYCSNLKRVAIPNGIQYIGNRTFAFSGLNEIEIGDGDNLVINREAFGDCFGLTAVYFRGGTISQIADGAFSRCNPELTIFSNGYSRYLADYCQRNQIRYTPKIE